jgi:mono/diheme cytochrome c family protein
MLLLAPSPARAAENGAAIFKQHCAPCHGADASGNTGMGRMLKLRDLKSAEVQKMTDAQFYELISHGKGKMPAFASSLGKEKIDAVIAYLRELAKEKK